MVVVSSVDMAREVLKAHDLAFALRPKLLSLDIICYKCTDIAFSPYGEYWRQMRKVCVMELLTVKNVRSFSSIRRNETTRLVEFIRSSTCGELINITEQISWYESSITCKAAFGELLKDQDKFIQILRELVELAVGFSVADIFPSIKILHVLSGLRKRILKVHKNTGAIVEDVINEHKKNIASGKKGNAGTETSGTTVIWAMTEMMRNPSVLAKAQAEVRETFKGKETFDEDVIEELKYLKQVVKETLRLHLPLALLVPRECRE
ncbi:Cytochrome 71D6 [Capsicum baccatum]|uniref:Cytochrome 71D6 n=1 Tax=Capsicum baccatum TaxID=33114 RepID=A0A2G2VUK4_CAPBA|nr:Cytochrome 71D6 [Capsicum baccatum]